jgi:glycosyltransferase involved in cell wall biosynthesis
MSGLVSPVLILTNQLHTGGAEIYVLTASRWLAERGVQVIIAATPGEFVSRIDPRVTYHPTKLDDLRADIGLAALRVRRLIKRYRPKVVLANSMLTAWTARLATVRRRAPIVAVAHGWPADRYRFVARPLRVADRVVAVSHDVARQLHKEGLPPRKTIIVPNGVDLSPFGRRTREQQLAAREVFGATEDDVVVASIGRYVPQKAQHHIIEIARRLRDELPELKYGLIGWGDLEDDLRRAIDAAGVGDIVKLLIRRRDVPDLLMASDLYLNTSNWEGMPLSMIEAMAAGLPIVTTDVEGMSALVDSDNGVLAPVGDVDALTEAVRRLGRDEVMRLQRGSESRARAEAKFSMDVMCARLAEVLAATVEG